MEKTIKTPEQLAQEHTAANLLNFLIAKTYSRHVDLSEEDFLAEIGFKGSGKTEPEAVRIATLNAMIEITRQIFAIRKSLELAHGIILNDVAPETKKETENGTGRN